MRSDLRGALFAATMLAAMPLSAGRTLPAEGKVEVAFAPWDDVERLVMDQIDGARQAVYVQAYTLTSRNIVKTLIAAAERGVKVEVVADRDKVLKDERSALPRAAGNGVKVWLDGDHAETNPPRRGRSPEGGSARAGGGGMLGAESAADLHHEGEDLAVPFDEDEGC